MKFINTLRLLFIVALTALVAASSHAATIKLNYDANYGAPIGFTSATSWRPIQAGELEFTTLENSTEVIQWDDSLSAFCIEPTASVASSATYDVDRGLGSWSGTTQALAIDRLFSTYYEESQDSSVKSAALQLALWEITHENSDFYALNGWYGGSFRTTGFFGARNIANGWLASLGETSATGMYNFYSLSSGDSQSLLTVTRASVPEPSSVLLVLAGLFALFQARRRLR